MNLVGNTWVSILRGTATNYAGDEIDTDTVIASRIPATLTERQRGTTQPVDGMSRTVRQATLRVKAGTDVRTNDRILDERTNDIYMISEVRRVGSPVTGLAQVAELIRVGANT